MINGTRSYNSANIFASNIGAPIYAKHILMDLKGEINRNT